MHYKQLGLGTVLARAQACDGVGPAVEPPGAPPARHRSPAEPAPRDSQGKKFKDCVLQSCCHPRIAFFNPVVTPGLRGTPRGTPRGQQPKNGWCLFRGTSEA